MNHHAIEILARDRIDGLAREAARNRLARGSQPRAEARSTALRGVLAGRLRAVVVRGRALVAGLRAGVART
jgi:hypothetical protein